MKTEHMMTSDKVAPRAHRPLALLLAVSGLGLWGCGGPVEESSSASVQQSLTPAEDEALAKTLAPRARWRLHDVDRADERGDGELHARGSRVPARLER